MRANTILIQFAFMAPVALCSPIPLVVVEGLEAVSGAAHPPAPIARSRPIHALPEVIVFNGHGEEEDGDQEAIDNRPITPSPTAQPSAVLASPRPVTTAYLLSLARHPWTRKKGGLLSQLPDEAVAAVESSSMTQAEMGLVVGEMRAPTGRTGMPCYHARIGRERNDYLAVALVVIFAAVVVVVETFTIAKRRLSRQGAIRLQDETGRDPRPLSVRAETTQTEKMLL